MKHGERLFNPPQKKNNKLFPICFHFTEPRLARWALNLGLSQTSWVSFVKLCVPEALGCSVCPPLPRRRYQWDLLCVFCFVSVGFVLLVLFCLVLCFVFPRSKNISLTRDFNFFFYWNMQTEGLLLHYDLYLKVLFLCANCQRGRQNFFRFKQNKHKTPDHEGCMLHAVLFLFLY